MTELDPKPTTLADKPVSRTGRLVCHRQRRRLLALLVVSVLVSLVWFFWPARPNLAGFDPAAMAQLETAMWRDYHGQRWLPLLGHTDDEWREVSRQLFTGYDLLRQTIEKSQRLGASIPTARLDRRLTPDKWLIPDSSPNCQHFLIGVECCEPPPSAPIFWHQYRNGQVTYFNASQLC